MSGAEGNVTTDTEIREGDWAMLLRCLKMEEGATREEWRSLEASKGWKMQWADPLPEPPKKPAVRPADFGPIYKTHFQTDDHQNCTVRNRVALRH